MATPSRRPAVSRPHPAAAAAAAAKAAAAVEETSSEVLERSTADSPAPHIVAAPPEDTSPQTREESAPAATAVATAPSPQPVATGEERGSVPTTAVDTVLDPSDAQPSSLTSPGTPRLVSGRVSFAGRATTVYFGSPDERDRVKAAFRARGGSEGYGSETDWYRDLILQATEAWEQEHNQGQPFQLRRRARR